MTSPKLKKMMEIITLCLDEKKIPFAVIGAMALGSYGLPRFTADIDIMAEGGFRENIREILQKTGFSCFQMSKNFAQFDSEMGVYGKIDCMFVRTEAGKNIIRRKITVSDSLMGNFPVICPEDYIVLKLLAIANNPERSAGDTADIVSVLRAFREKELPEIFPAINPDSLRKYAAQFGQELLMRNLWNDVFASSFPKRNFFL